MLTTIKRIVAEYYHIRVADIEGLDRTKAMVIPRRTAMLLSRKVTRKSFSEIGRALGGRDHTTVMHGVARAEIAKNTDAEYRAEIEEMRIKIAQDTTPAKFYRHKHFEDLQ